MHSFAGSVSPDEIISDVSMMVDDEPMKAFSYGFYLSQVQQALSELAFDTLFDERTIVTPMPANGILPMPPGIVNLDGIYLFNGNNCGASGVQKVWYSVRYFRYGGAMFKDQRGVNGNDPIMEDTITGQGNLYFYGQRHSEYHFSDACSGFENLLIKYRGMGCNIGDQPIIPHELRQAVKNYVAMAVLQVRFAQEPLRWREVYNEIKRSHHGGNGNFDVGTWRQAQRRMQDEDFGSNNDMKKYLSNLSLKIAR